MFHSLQSQWFAVQVRPQSEKMVSALLGYKGYETLLPLCTKRTGRRPGQQGSPLFPGYVFCQVASTAQGLIVTTPGVMRIVGIGNRPEPIPEHEINSLIRVIQSGMDMEQADLFEVGDIVELAQGPLKGCRGIVKRVHNKDRLIISVTLLQRSVSVEVNRAWAFGPGVEQREMARRIA